MHATGHMVTSQEHIDNINDTARSGVGISRHYAFHSP